MYCTKCGTQLKDDSKFCHNCGASVKPDMQNDPLGPDIFAPATPPTAQPATQTYTHPASQQQAAPQTTNANDGIQGLLGFIFSFLIPIAGLILSIIGMKKTKYRGFAIAGLVISIVNMAVTFIVYMIYFATAANYSYYDNLFDDMVSMI